MSLNELLTAYQDNKPLSQAYEIIFQEIEDLTNHLDNKPVYIIIKDKKFLTETLSTRGARKKVYTTINYFYNQIRSLRLIGAVYYIAKQEEITKEAFKEWAWQVHEEFFNTGLIDLKQWSGRKVNRWWRQFLKGHKHWLRVYEEKISLTAPFKIKKTN